MNIKTLSVWQPNASLIADGHKRFETRSWSTRYRGPLLICAAMRCFDPESFRKEVRLLFDGRMLPLGQSVAVVELTNIFQVDDPNFYHHAMKEYNQDQIIKELALGDYSPGRFAWDLQNVRKLAEPFPVKGRQGLFNVEIPDGLLEVA